MQRVSTRTRDRVWLLSQALGLKADVLDPDSQEMRTIVIVHAAFGLLILCAAWRVHVRTKPYAFIFQNNLETWLFGVRHLACLPRRDHVHVAEIASR